LYRPAGIFSKAAETYGCKRAGTLKKMAKYFFRKSTILITLLMVISAAFTRQLMELAVRHIGKNGFKILVMTSLSATAGLFFISEAKRLLKPAKVLLMLGLLTLSLLLVWNIRLPQVRMHILMYAVVGWLASRDAMRAGRSWKTIALAWIFAAAAGILEELFQKLLPYRVFDINDIIFNLKGATLGVILYLVRPGSKKP